MTTAGNNILVIDDDREFLEKIRVSMGFSGYRVLPVSNPAAALETFVASEFNVVITDLCMPEMSGLAVLKEILKISPQTWVIVISGQTDEKTRNEVLRDGAAAFLTKPLDLNELEAKVKQLLALSAEGAEGGNGTHTNRDGTLEG